MKNDSKRNIRPRDKKGRFVSMAAVYSCKHNTVDFSQFYKEKLKEWEEKGLCKAEDIITPFEYRPEAFNVPTSYMYGPDEIEKVYSDEDRDYALVMADLSLGEKSPYIAKLIPLQIGAFKEPLYVKNELWHNESLALVHLDDLSQDLDLSIPADSILSDEQKLSQGVVAKHKLKDLVIDTCYKLDFNKAIKNCYIHKNNLFDESAINVCRYYNSPINIFGYVDVSYAIFEKTKFDEDGDRIINTVPVPKCVIVDLGDKLVAYYLDDDSFEEIKSLVDLVSLLPNLMIPEEMLRRLAKIEMFNRNGETSDKPKEETSISPLPYGVRLNLCLDTPIEIAIITNISAIIEHTSVRQTKLLKVYRLGEFRAPRFQTMARVQSEINNPVDFQLAIGPNDLWILIDEKVDKIYLYSAKYSRIIDWCLTTTFDVLNMINKFSSSFLPQETKTDLLEAIHNIRKNYYSKGIISAEKNEGLTEFLENL